MAFIKTASATAALMFLVGSAAVQLGTRQATEGNRVLAQAVPVITKLSEVRREALRDFRPDPSERIHMGKRIVIMDAAYTNSGEDKGKLTVTAKVHFKDDAGFIDGIKTELQLQYKGGSSSDIPAFRDIPSLRQSAVTGTDGMASYSFLMPRELGLMPGEYYLKLTVTAAAQTEKVKGRMRNDVDLFNRAAFFHPKGTKDAKGNTRSSDEPFNDVEFKNGCDEEWRTILRQDAPIPSTQYKIFVAENDTWMDDGTAGDIEELRGLDERVRKYRARVADLNLRITELKKNGGDPNKEEPQQQLQRPKRDENGKVITRRVKDANGNEVKDKNGKPLEEPVMEPAVDKDGNPIYKARAPSLREQLEIAKEILEAGDAELTFRGGAIKPEELQLHVSLRNRYNKMREQISVWDEEVLYQYCSLLYSEFDYWAWKASQLYGNPVYFAIKQGQMPWEANKLLIEDETVKPGEPKDPKKQDRFVANMGEWKVWMSKQAQYKVNGKPHTWGAKDPKQQDRGGMYSPTLLNQMLKDIQEFDLMKLIEPKKGSDGKPDPKGGFQLKRGESGFPDEWMKFERSFRAAIGIDEEQPEGLKTWEFKTYPSQRNIVKGLPDAMTTGARVRSMNAGTAYGYAMTRFPEANAVLKDILSDLALMPMAYRYTFHVDCEKVLDGVKEEKERQSILNSLLGTTDEFPDAARTMSGPMVAKYKGDVEAAIKDIKLYPWYKTIYNVWAWTEGHARNNDEKKKQDVLKGFQKQLAERFTKNSAIPSGGNVGDPSHSSDDENADPNGDGKDERDGRK